MSRHLAGPRRALRCGSRFVQWFLKVFPPPGGPGKWGADQRLAQAGQRRQETEGSKDPEPTAEDVLAQLDREAEEDAEE